jgi:hypothetical protein
MSRWLQAAQDAAFARLGKRLHERVLPKWDVFLSHAGEDRETAATISARVNNFFQNQGRSVTVFNTSESQFRFKDRSERALLLPEVVLYDQELAEYLIENMIASRAYLLLITPLSLKLRKDWVEFEIEVGTQVARELRRCFFPCFANGAKLTDLYALQREVGEFQSVDLSVEMGLVALLRVLREVIADG